MNIVRDGLTPIAELSVFLIIVTGVVYVFFIVLSDRISPASLVTSFFAFVGSVTLLLLSVTPHGSQMLFNYTLSGKIISEASIEETGKQYVRFNNEHPAVVVNNPHGIELVGNSVRLTCGMTSYYTCDIMVK